MNKVHVKKCLLKKIQPGFEPQSSEQNWLILILKVHDVLSTCSDSICI